MKKLLFIILIILGTIKSVARDFYTDNMTSVQTNDIARYGDLATSLFTGCYNISIPIYSLNDPDFNMNIELNYNAEGFKPFKNSGYVGLNWSLQAGGCITREVRNYPDEIFRQMDTGGHKTEGMYHFVQHHSIDKNDVFSQNANAITNCNGYGSNSSYSGYNIGTDCNISVDYMPDIYHFNFCGYHGTFVINNEGNVVILSGDYVFVDLSQTIDTKPELVLVNRPLPVDSSKITIKTKDGYTYIFGGELSALEYSIPLLNGQQEQQQVPPIINAWYLTKVIAPNERMMTYYYTGHNSSGIPSNNLFAFNLYNDLFAAPTDPENPTINYHLKYSYTKECILDSICISGEHPLTVHFYKSLAQKMYNHAQYSLCYENYKLDSVHIISNERVIRSASLSYEYKSRTLGNSSAFYWRFLSKVILSGKGSYTLSYRHNYQYPNLYIYTNNDLRYMIDLYGYWKTSSTQGLLDEVIYPTGGKQHFYYEQNNYGAERKFQKINSNKDVLLFTDLYNTNFPTGGARIQKIETLIGDSLIEKKEYSYTNQGSSISSGILYNNLIIHPENPSGNALLINNGNNYSLLDTHIAYSYVEERTYNGLNRELSKTAYVYDIGLKSFSTLGNESIYKPISDSNSEIYGKLSSILTYDDRIYMKGKLQLVRYYKGDTLIKTTNNIYNGVPLLPTEIIPENSLILGCVDTIVVFSNYGDHPISRKLYVYPDVMTQEVTKDYTQASTMPLIYNHAYLHDKKLRLLRETTTDSRGIAYFTKYTYPDQLHIHGNQLLPSEKPALYLLQQRRLINEPIEIISGYMDGDTEYVTSGTIHLYNVGSYVQPQSGGQGPNPPSMEIHYYPYLYQTWSLPLINPISDYQPMSTSGTDVTYDSYYVLNSEYSFDRMGRMTSIKPFGKIETRYTWNGIYPETKTLGNQTWHYSYEPYVGLTASTDPRGITTYYKYDSTGRLIEEYQIVNGNKQVLNVYQYHIKTE